MFLRVKREGSTRVILNLKNLNKKIEHIHFKMETIKDAIRLMKKNCKFASIDFKHAYYTVNILNKGRKCFRFQQEGHSCQFTCLPHGFSPAPRLFTKLSKPTYAFLREIEFVIVGFIDDSLLVFYEGDEMTPQVMRVTQFFDELGLTIHLGKICHGTSLHY